MSAERELYPRNEFVTEANRTESSQTVGGWKDPGDKLMLKFVTPGLARYSHNEFDIAASLVVYQTAIHDDLCTALEPAARIQGVGTLTKRAEKRTFEIVRQGADVIVGQLAAGGLFGMFEKLRNRYQGIIDASFHNIDINMDDKSIGSVQVSSVTLPRVSYLSRNGFPFDKFAPEMQSEVPETGVFLVRIKACFSRDQVEEIFQTAGTDSVNTRYGVPRLVVRVGLPEAQLGNLGSEPHAKLHAATRSMVWGDDVKNMKQWPSYAAHTKKIPIAPVRHIKGHMLEHQCADILSESLRRHTNEYSARNNASLRYTHIAMRHYEMYQRYLIRALAFCRKAGCGDDVPEVMQCFSSAFQQYVISQEQEGNIGIANLPFNFASAPGATQGVGKFMTDEGNTLIAEMIRELRVTTATCDDPHDYIVRRYEQAQQDSTVESVVPAYNIPSAVHAKECMSELVAQRIDALRGTIKGKRRKARRSFLQSEE